MAQGCLAQGDKLDCCFLLLSNPTTALCTHILCHMTLQGPHYTRRAAHLHPPPGILAVRLALLGGMSAEVW